MITYNTIEGYPISDVKEHLDQFFAADLFVASQQILSNVSPDRTYDSHGNHYENEYRSIKVSYNQLSDQLFNDICSLYGLENMAWESSSDYSLANHIHNYSRASFSAYMTPPIVGKYDEDARVYKELSNIATISINGKYKTISMPQIHIYRQPRAYIGQLKFLATPTFKVVDEYDASFDGWTYPDGRSFPSSDFTDAWNAFGTTYGWDAANEKFSIPNLKSFIKPMRFAYADINTSLAIKHNGHSNLETHVHNAKDIHLSGTATINLKVPTSTNDQSSPGYHTGDVNAAHTTPDAVCVIDISKLGNVNGATTTSDPEKDVQTHPTYNFIPVMIYIGSRSNG